MGVQEFLQTGQSVVGRYRQILSRLGAPAHFDRLLDFGCGIGRLTLAWAPHANRVIGVDVSPPMIVKRKGGYRLRAELVLNTTADLKISEDDSFDLIFSHIVQHIPWEHAAGYIREFARVCRPGGWVIFQLPVRGTLHHHSGGVRNSSSDY